MDDTETNYGYIMTYLYHTMSVLGERLVNWHCFEAQGPGHRVGPGSVSGVEGVIGPEHRQAHQAVGFVVKKMDVSGHGVYSTSNCSI